MTTDPSGLSYEFLAPSRIVFGWGRRREVGALGRTLGRRAFVVHGLPPDIADRVIGEVAASLEAEGVEAVALASLAHEPEVDDVDRLAAQVRERGVGPSDFLVAIGGGAAIDLAKATAALALSL